MASISLRGAYLRHLTMRHDEASNSTYAILSMGADFSDTVCEKMGWPTALPEGFRLPAKLKGELRDCDGLVMTPNGAELKKHEMQISLDTVGSFALVGIKDGEDEKSELRFEIRTNQKDACAWVEKYFRSIGKGVGVLKVKYGHMGQGELEEEPEAAEETEGRQQSLPDMRDMGAKVRGGRRAANAEVN